MKNMWQVRKAGEILLFMIAIIFAVLFYRSGQYWLSLFALVLTVIALRINDLKMLKVNPNEGITLELNKAKELKNKAKEKISVIINSHKSPQEKIEESQKVVDEVFKLGYRAGGGKSFTDVSNVKIVRDEEGRVIRYQYDES